MHPRIWPKAPFLRLKCSTRQAIRSMMLETSRRSIATRVYKTVSELSSPNKNVCRQSAIETVYTVPSFRIDIESLSAVSHDRDLEQIY